MIIVHNEETSKLALIYFLHVIWLLDYFRQPIEINN